jgi:hypothetical protein
MGSAAELNCEPKPIAAIARTDRRNQNERTILKTLLFRVQVGNQSSIIDTESFWLLIHNCLAASGSDQPPYSEDLKQSRPFSQRDSHPANDKTMELEWTKVVSPMAGNGILKPNWATQSSNRPLR